MGSFIRCSSFLRVVRQLMVYGAVGLLSNAVGYSCYLLLTYFGTTPKLTMTLLYVIGAYVSFQGNRKFTFPHSAGGRSVYIRGVISYALGYLLNFSLLLLFVDHLGFPHQLVQAIAVFVIAAFLFLLFKFFVFPRAVLPRLQE